MGVLQSRLVEREAVAEGVDEGLVLEAQAAAAPGIEQIVAAVPVEAHRQGDEAKTLVPVLVRLLDLLRPERDRPGERHAFAQAALEADPGGRRPALVGIRVLVGELEFGQEGQIAHPHVRLAEAADEKTRDRRDVELRADTLAAAEEVAMLPGDAA